MEEKNIDNREFQNLLAIRNQLVMLLIATSGGVIWLAQDPLKNINWIFILIGTFFAIRTIISTHKINEK